MNSANAGAGRWQQLLTPNAQMRHAAYAQFAYALDAHIRTYLGM